MGLRAPRAFLDSCVVVYVVENPGALGRDWTERLRLANARFCVSEIVRLECLVAPYRARDANLIADFEAFFAGAAVDFVPLDRTVCDRAARLRAGHGLRTPDALNLAAALRAGCTEFWTNDRRLASVAVDLRIVTV